MLDAGDMDVFAESLETGETLALGVVPSLEPDTVPTATALTERVLRWLDMVGLDIEVVSERLVMTPTCGLAGASPDWARQALALCREVARNLTASPE
jgi:methionine synthase II (cobalamin-independent)